MNRKTTVKFIAAIFALIICVSIFVACGNKSDGPTKYYDIPEGLSVSIDIYDGAAKLGTITNETLAKVSQEKLTMTTTNSSGTETTVVYLAYNFKTLCEKANIALPQITSFKSEGPGGTKGLIDHQYTSVQTAYVTIGSIVSDGFEADSNSPRFIPASNTTSSKQINKGVYKITFNPIEE